MKIKRGDPDVRETMEPLERLDLSKCNTVGELVEGMRKCSFGARMLGNMAATLTEWVAEEQKPLVVYDDGGGPVWDLLTEWQEAGWISGNINSWDLPQHDDAARLVVVGEYAPLFTEEISRRGSENVIFVNKSGQAIPGHYRDGYFPNMVASDPSFVVPVLDATVRERLYGSGQAYSVHDFVTSMLHGFPDLATGVREAANTLKAMVDDPDCTIFLTLSGAMTVAKMGLLIDDMIRLGLVDYVSSTGALMAHGLIEGVGLRHYAYDPKFSDKLLASQGLNRVTDSLEPEENFDHIDDVIHEVLLGFSGKRPLSPSQFHRAIGKYLARKYPNERAILRSAYEQDVPVLVPAFADSEIGNDVFVHNLWRQRRHMPRIVFNQELDSRVLVNMATRAKKLGIFSIGGGVPRNNTQNVAPLVEIINGRLNTKLPPSMFTYGCRIDPTPLFYGNLSGCTYSEGGSWRKFDLKNGRLTEVSADATIVWPFILKTVLATFEGREKPRLRRAIRSHRRLLRVA